MHGTDTRTVGNNAGIRVPEHEKHGTVSPLLFGLLTLEVMIAMHTAEAIATCTGTAPFNSLQG